MTEHEQTMEQLIEAFHQTWDAFPGVTRLIGKGDLVLASNKAAEAAGLTAGQICARMGAPESHRGCRKALALRTQTSQIDRPAEGKIRGWIPVAGYPEVVVHFSLALPDVNPVQGKA